VEDFHGHSVPESEGGHYRETFRDPPNDANGRCVSTAILFLLTRGERSHWHRVDAAEIWHHYAGSALFLEIVEDGHKQSVRLGSDIAAGETPQAIVPAYAWQAAHSTGAWTLVGCTVAPGLISQGLNWRNRTSFHSSAPCRTGLSTV
jgi:uncharacterized protein